MINNEDIAVTRIGIEYTLWINGQVKDYFTSSFTTNFGPGITIGKHNIILIK